MKYISIDLFSGAGGMSEGLKMAHFITKFAFEIDEVAALTYKLNHNKTKVYTQDIRTVKTDEIKRALKGGNIHLLAGCPPCQGFSSIRRLNRNKPVDDERNNLINEYVRFVVDLRPYTIMLENVPGLAMSDDFHKAIDFLREKGYYIEYNVLNVKDYGVPQSRKRLVMVGSRLGKISIAEPTKEICTVRDTIAKLPSPEYSDDEVHKIYPHHIERIKNLIKQIPHNGGSLKDLGEEWQLACHKSANVGFNDVYGRLRWDSYSTTITGGCLNPSKGRFLHPEQDRCISAREAAMLQTFPVNYKFPTNVAKTKIALMIGNALPPKFCKIQADNIRNHLDLYLKR
jgi:DNA (cytosine-5)-methyltransferase 1